LPSSDAPVVDPSTYGDLDPNSIAAQEYWIKNLEIPWTAETCIMGSINLM
ncbi:hypothetical protein BgiBS90_029331, partial [Biomphalaria glabrata]